MSWVLVHICVLNSVSLMDIAQQVPSEHVRARGWDPEEAQRTQSSSSLALGSMLAWQSPMGPSGSPEFSFPFTGGRLGLRSGEDCVRS